jgi:hypothetical protein
MRRSGVRVSPPGCREPSGSAHEAVDHRDGPHPLGELEPSRQVRTSSFSPSVPPACHKQRSRGVCSENARSLREDCWTGRRPFTCGGGAARNCIACRRSTDPSQPLLRSAPACRSATRSSADNYGQRRSSIDLREITPPEVTILPDLALGARGRHSNAAFELSQAPQLGAQ